MKAQLADLIEAYAAARCSGNRMLIEYAAVKLNEFMAGVEVVPKEIVEEAPESK